MQPDLAVLLHAAKT